QTQPTTIARTVAVATNHYRNQFCCQHCQNIFVATDHYRNRCCHHRPLPERLPSPPTVDIAIGHSRICWCCHQPLSKL
ncbi:hypothetical protein U1Q18_007748, partial [Sarracenia purpurea var. burkii]